MNILLVGCDSVSQNLVRKALKLTEFPNSCFLALSPLQFLEDSSPNFDQFDLIFCQVTDSEPFVFDVLKRDSMATPIIFLAHSTEYAYQATQFFCLDFILLPANENRIIQAFEKTRKINSILASKFRKETRWNEEKPKSFRRRFLTKIGKKYVFIPTQEIAFFFTEDGITYLMENGSSNKYILNHSLNELENDLLDPFHFYRINRSMIINLESLIEIKPYVNGRLVLSMNSKFEEMVVVARERVSEFKNWINQ
jgi:DNA-binding LytR/AlgR family response regulator